MQEDGCRIKTRKAGLDKLFRSISEEVTECTIYSLPLGVPDVPASLHVALWRIYTGIEDKPVSIIGGYSLGLSSGEPPGSG